MNLRNGLFKFFLREKVFFINSIGICVYNKGRLFINVYFWYRIVLVGIFFDLEIFYFFEVEVIYVFFFRGKVV